MKIYLKKNWSESIDYENETGLFVGRDKETNHLKLTIINNDSGSILVSGVRGVGKTSFVYKVIQELRSYYKKSKEKTLIPIVISASQLEFTKTDDSELYKKLIENLIRRLFASFEHNNEKIPGDLEALYKKVQGQYSKRLENYNSSSLEVENKEEDKEIDRQEITKVFSNESWVLYLKIFFSILGGGLVFITDLMWLKIIGISLLIIPNVSLAHIQQKILYLLKTRKASKKLTARELYEEDNSIGNLEFDLDKFLDINFIKYKFLFVIDELDKIDEEATFHIIKMYKNLFNLSKSNFIFITDQEAYFTVVKGNPETKVEPTLFTHRYYLNLPDREELVEYMGKIFEKCFLDSKLVGIEEIPEEAVKDFENFSNYVLYRSKNDLFCLKSEINGLSLFDKNGQFVDLNSIKSEEGEFDYDMKWNLGLAIDQIYHLNKSKALINWHKNASKIKNLFNFVYEYYFEDIPFEKLKQESKAVLNLVEYLKRLEVLEETTYQEDPNEKVLIWTNHIPAVPESPVDLFESEQDFISSFIEYIETINEIIYLPNASKSLVRKRANKIEEGEDGRELTGINAFNVYEKYRSDFESLHEQPPRHIAQEDLEQYIAELEEEKKKISSVSFKVLENALDKINSNEEFGLVKNKSGDRPELVATILDFKNFLNSKNHWVYYNDQFSKQIILVENLVEAEIDNNIKKAIRAQKDNILVVNLVNQEGLTVPKNFYSEEEYIIENKKGEKVEKIKKVKITNILNIEFIGSYSIIGKSLKEISEWIKR